MDYNLTTDWAESNQGYTAKAEKSGTKFFLKRYVTVKKPRENSPGLTPAMYEKKLNKYNAFKGYRIRINESLQSVSAWGGNIIYPTDWFDEEVFFVEATQFVDGLLSEDDLDGLAKDQKLFWATTAAAALDLVHSKNIVHSDIKPGNLLAAKLPNGKVVAKLLDFDISYFADDIRDDPGGTLNYMAPELVWYSNSEDKIEAAKKLSTKADIFSLGVLFYKVLTNKFPTPVTVPPVLRPDIVDVGQILACRGVIKIGTEIEDEYVRILIANMLHPDYTQRPTAKEVMEILRDKKIVPLKPTEQVVVDGVAVPEPEPDPILSTPWDEHNITFNMDKIEAAGFKGGVQRYQKPSGLKVYKVFMSPGKNAMEYKVDAMLMLGFATKKAAGTEPVPPVTPPVPPVTPPVPPVPPVTREPAPVSVPEPKPPKLVAGLEIGPCEVWPEHSEFRIDEDAVKAQGYAAIVRAEKKATGLHGYALQLPDGKYTFYKLADVKTLGYVKKI